MKDEGESGTRMVGSALLTAFLLTGCAALHTANPQVTEAQIQQRLQDVFAAAESRDFNRLDDYHLYGPKFTKFTGSSIDRLDAAAARKGEHDELGRAEGLKMRADALKIDVFGNIGIATCILHCGLEAGGEVVHKKHRSTLVFVKEGGEWKIAHEHLSPIDR